MEGMQAFMRRHGPSLPPRDTFVLASTRSGRPHLTAIRGEGMLDMNEYPRAGLDLVDRSRRSWASGCSRTCACATRPTACIALKQGYPCACLGSVTDYKAPSNYHWRTDTAENVDYETFADGVRLCEGIVQPPRRALAR